MGDAVNEKLGEIEQLLNNPNLDELQNYLKTNFLRFKRHWEQRIEKLDNYGLLQQKTHELQGEPNVWFYIGYTNQGNGGIWNYLWDTEPKSAEAKRTIQENHLEKSCTYYTHLVDSPGQTERALIQQIFSGENSERCLNVQAGEEQNTGIAYVLEYTKPPEVELKKKSSLMKTKPQKETKK